MIKISNIKIEKDDIKLLSKKIDLILNRKNTKFEIYRKSIDARKGISFNFQVLVDIELSEKELKKIKNAQVYEEENFKLTKNNKFNEVLVVGAGPSGLFAAYILSSYGVDVILIERGLKIEERALSVDEFFRSGVLNPESNIQFGEGGAGTFSDGKLTARAKDKRQREVLRILVENGAPKDILIDQKPHIGTDLLRQVIVNMREKMTSWGVKFFFDTKMENIEIEDGKISSVITNRGNFSADQYIFALGNSARDTVYMLKDKVKISNKPFAVGFRIEHPQKMIDFSQYHVNDESLPKASYALTYSEENSRGVYTFCMCPGGYVINASSYEGMLCVNGMSYHDRAGANANSALVCGIDESIYGNGFLAGLKFQEEMERRAFELGGGGYIAPIQKVGDFLRGEISKEIGSVVPTIKPGYVFKDLNQIYPEKINSFIKNALINMGKKLKGFDMEDAILTGVETRTSCAVRFDRDENLRSLSLSNLLCIGEGAGYAGGIVSSAIDGIKAAEVIVEGR